MKRERYFRDELRRLFIGYAMIPAVLFTAACVLGFMAVTLHSRKSISQSQIHYVVQELEQVLTEYDKGLKQLAEELSLMGEDTDQGERSRIFEAFYQMNGELGCKSELFILGEDRQCRISTGRELPQYLNVAPDIHWGIYEAIEESPKSTAFRLEGAVSGGEGVLVMGRRIWREGEPSGYVVFTIPSAQFQKSFDRSDLQTVVTDPFGWIYFSNNRNFQDSSRRLASELRYGRGYLSYESHQYLMTRQPVKLQMPSEGRTRADEKNILCVYVFSDIQNIVWTLGICSAFLATALVVMSLWVLASTRRVTEKKTADFYRILDVMERAEKGDLDGVITAESNNEFQVIAQAYNQMIASLKKQMENNRRMTELLSVSITRQLESQFNPHFLFNTLENIRYMCKLDPAVAERMVFSLSGLLRYSLDSSQTEVTLKADLEHLENYLNILRLRFGNRLDCRLEVEPEALDCRIPKLVFQPLIENAVKYGFGTRAHLTVELKAYVHEDTLFMICRDDGQGLTQEALSQVTALLGEKEHTGRHSGLYNIHRRIQILYGKTYGVDIRSREGYGAMLTVTLPARREEKDAESTGGRG